MPVFVTFHIELIPVNRAQTFDLNHGSLVRTVTGSVLVADEMPALSQLEIDRGSQTDIISSMTSVNGTSTIHPQMHESAKTYRPPVFSARFQNESKVPPPIIRDTLNIDEYPRGKISTAWINMVKQGMSDWIRIPVIIARGVEDG